MMTKLNSLRKKSSMTLFDGAVAPFYLIWLEDFWLLTVVAIIVVAAITAFAVRMIRKNIKKKNDDLTQEEGKSTRDENNR